METASLDPRLRLFQRADLKGKIVLVRVDHNVVKKGRINDPYRIDVTFPTLYAIAEKGGRPILMTHVGRPKDKKTGKINKWSRDRIMAIKGALNFMIADDKALEVRRFNPEDAQEVSCLIRQSLEPSLVTYPKAKEIYDRYSPQYIISSSRKRDTYVAVAGGSIVGTVSYKGRTIYGLYNSPGCMRMGIGKHLIGYAEKLISREHDSAILEAMPHSKGFFQKLGYSGVRDIKLDSGRKVILMKKRLKK